MFRRVLLALLFICASSLPAQAKGKGPVVHTVYPGQTLGMIAKRYVVSIDAICNANGIERRTPIKPKQKLVIPERSDADGSVTRKLVLEGKFRDRGIGPAPSKRSERAEGPSNRTSAPEPRAKRTDDQWKRFVKPARRKGYVVLEGTGRRWSGYAIVKGNKISSRAQAAFRRVLYSWRTGDEHDVDPRLIRLLTEVSDKFGGRPLKIVSGFRERSYARESKHKSGRACDFSIEGVPNEALHAYLSTLEGVGVGYYPNSTFVHLDVRPKTTHWVDHSGPGEAPVLDGAPGGRADAGASD